MRKGDFTMIYFDNAATTRRKPQEVVQAVTEALCSLGNAGRGAHEATLRLLARFMIQDENWQNFSMRKIRSGWCLQAMQRRV